MEVWRADVEVWRADVEVYRAAGEVWIDNLKVRSTDVKAWRAVGIKVPRANVKYWKLMWKWEKLTWKCGELILEVRRAGKNVAKDWWSDVEIQLQGADIEP